MTIEKRRDDWFRHIFLGFGSGDLVVRTAGADRHDILMPTSPSSGSKLTRSSSRCDNGKLKRCRGTSRRPFDMTHLKRATRAAVR